MNCEAYDLYLRGNYSEAIEKYTEVLQKQKEYNNDLGEASALNSIGLSYYYWGKYLDAQSFLKQALELRQQNTSTNPLDMADTLNWLGNAHYSQREYSEAEVYYREAVKIYENKGGSDSSNMTVFRRNLAQSQVKQDKFDEAEAIYDRLLNMQKSEPLEQAAIHIYKAELYEAKKDYESAEKAYLKGLEMQLKQLSPDSPAIASANIGLGEFYVRRGRYSEAEQSYKTALAIKEKVFAADYPVMAGNLSRLAGVYSEQEGMPRPYLCINVLWQYIKQNTGKSINTWQSS